MPPCERIIVIGTTGSGKSTLAKLLAKKFDSAFIELDALYWEANWEPAPFEVFYERVEAATESARWVAAGNYRVARALIWDRADTIVWLDYPFWFTFWRLWRRTWRRSISQEALWNGNRENIWKQLQVWSQESLIHWFLATYWPRKKEFGFLLSQPEYAPKALRFTSQRDVDEWLRSFK